ncbi:MAG: HD domain-containing protein [Bacillota bacterium]|nr:HD domain-containing protein [Bacillota bacterium]
MNKITALTWKMTAYFQDDPKRIHHFLKVHALAKAIAVTENYSGDKLFTLEAAALIHDIGIKNAEAKFGSANGKLQEQEGPKPAEDILKKLDFPPETIERVVYLVAHHHTYSKIEGMDHQILVEADFLVNFYEDQSSPQSIKAAYNKIFKTKAGKELCKTLYASAFEN